MALNSLHCAEVPCRLSGQKIVRFLGLVCKYKVHRHRE